ncbi:rho GTPase-activating protein SYDE1 isoform X2 [Stigmatopora nigra]
MAQPLLKRTFSRLRGKERSHGKTEAPGRRRSGPPSPPATSKSRGAEPLSPPMTTKSGEAEPPSLGRVTKRQRWQGRAAPVASPDPVADGRSSSFGSDGWNGASVPRPPTMRPAAAVVVTDEPSVTRTYLQSLDRSSRNWVLSSGKSEALDEGRGSRPESGGGGDDDDDIWYNPIPEEGEASAQMGRSPGPAENVMRAVGKDDAPSGVDDSESQTAVPKRSGVMDRLRSPGTVRRLSLKMRKLPELGRKLSLRSSRAERGGQAAGGAAKSASEHNVLSRYHLDTSAPPTSPRGRSASKGGHLSDGDSPEVGDSGSFPLYRASETSRLCRRTTGLLTVHLVGLDHIGTTKESDGGRDIFLAIQIDGTTRARTSTLNFRGQGIPLNHTFRLELERARLLRVVVLMPAAGSESDRPKNRICCLGGVAIPSLFEGSRCQRLCVQLEPKGLLYIKLSLREHRDAQCGDGGGGGGDPAAPSKVFGVELRHLMEEEGTTVPLLIQKTVADIERRGLKAVGLYRLCGSAAVKKELRDRFEADSSAVRLGEDLYPDVNVITGILKDYLRELPSSLITATLYQAVEEAASRPPQPQLRLAAADDTVALLTCLPAPERATLTFLLEHLSLVAHFSSCNRMTHQNLAVCFGPVLLKQSRGRGGPTGERWPGAVDFKRHVEALHYLLRSWPVPWERIPPVHGVADGRTQNGSWRLPEGEAAPVVVAAAAVPRRGRDGVGLPDSPPPVNRYAGDWSVCGRNLPSGREADYDEVAGSEDEEKEEGWLEGGSGGALHAEDAVDLDTVDLDAPFNCRLSLKDFDNLIGDLDRELAKHINICT